MTGAALCACQVRRKPQRDLRRAAAVSGVTASVPCELCQTWCSALHKRCVPARLASRQREWGARIAGGTLQQSTCEQWFRTLRSRPCACAPITPSFMIRRTTSACSSTVPSAMSRSAATASDRVPVSLCCKAISPAAAMGAARLAHAAVLAASQLACPAWHRLTGIHPLQLRSHNRRSQLKINTQISCPATLQTRRDASIMKMCDAASLAPCLSKI